MNKDSKIVIIVIAIIIPILSLLVWNSENSNFQIESIESERRIVAVASFFPIYDFTKQVGGEKVDVHSFVPAGVEPHDYEPTIHNIETIQSADIIFINGIGFEHWLENLETIIPDSDVMIIDTSSGISVIEDHKDEIEDHKDEIEDHKDEHSHDDLLADPHIWLNPIYAKVQVENIVQGLIENDPQNSDYYRKNANTYLAKLDLLDSNFLILTFSLSIISCKDSLMNSALRSPRTPDLTVCFNLTLVTQCSFFILNSVLTLLGTLFFVTRIIMLCVPSSFGL